MRPPNAGGLVDSPGWSPVSTGARARRPGRGSSGRDADVARAWDAGRAAGTRVVPPPTPRACARGPAPARRACASGPVRAARPIDGVPFRSDLHQRNVFDLFSAQLAILLHQMPKFDELWAESVVFRPPMPRFDEVRRSPRRLHSPGAGSTGRGVAAGRGEAGWVPEHWIPGLGQMSPPASLMVGNAGVGARIDMILRLSTHD
jgi:hypothetical protein